MVDYGATELSYHGCVIASGRFNLPQLRGSDIHEGTTMPMCQSPKILENLLRVNTVALNDNVPAEGNRVKAPPSESAFKAIWLPFRLARHHVLQRILGRSAGRHTGASTERR
jgi:hypothetical protein